MTVKLAADPVVQKAAAAAFGGATWWATAKDIALELFGVPVQVVLAAATAAFFAGSFCASAGYMASLLAGVVWTMFGSWSSQLALSLIAGWMKIPVPTGALAGGAIVVAGLGRLLVTRENIQKARAAVGRLFDGIGSKP